MKGRIREQTAGGSQMRVTTSGAVVREDKRVELQSEEPFLCNAERCELENGMRTTLLVESRKKAVDRQRVDCPTGGRPLGIGQTENQGADQPGPDTGRAKSTLNEMTYGGFPLCTRDADERELPMRIAEHPRAGARVGPIDIVDDCIRHVRRKRCFFF